MGGLPGVETIEGLNFLEKAGEISIGSAQDLHTIQGFEGLESLYRLSLSTNQNLEFVKAFPYVDEIASVELSFNIILPDLSMFERVKRIGLKDELLPAQGLVIDSNYALVDLRGMENVEFISAFYIQYNRGMETLDGLESAEELSYLQVDNNPILHSLGSLGETVKRVPLGIRMMNNPLLKRCEVEAFIAGLEEEPEIVELTNLSEEPCD
ncbi:hypothetical protein DV096_16800 [Bradymonadaceae bacterium TMQ3]|nr:hypothetical protein DV096_16800 [Bradymonadaceae bacterium TMQ3]